MGYGYKVLYVIWIQGTGYRYKVRDMDARYKMQQARPLHGLGREYLYIFLICMYNSETLSIIKPNYFLQEITIEVPVLGPITFTKEQILGILFDIINVVSGFAINFLFFAYTL